MKTYNIERKTFWLDGRVDITIINSHSTNLTDVNNTIWTYAEALKERMQYTKIELGSGYSTVYFTMNSDRHRIEFTRLPNITNIV